jgi:hypothetical protein
MRTHRFAGEELQRTKTDAIDALGIARFAAQKRPAPTRLLDAVSQELRELVRLRDRLSQDFGDRPPQQVSIVLFRTFQLLDQIRDLNNASLHHAPPQPLG